MRISGAAGVEENGGGRQVRVAKLLEVRTMIVVAAGVACGAVYRGHDGRDGARIINVEGTLKTTVIHGEERYGGIDGGMYGDGGRTGGEIREGRRRRAKESFECEGGTGGLGGSSVAYLDEGE